MESLVGLPEFQIANGKRYSVPNVLGIRPPSQRTSEADAIRCTPNHAHHFDLCFNRVTGDVKDLSSIPPFPDPEDFSSYDAFEEALLDWSHTVETTLHNLPAIQAASIGGGTFYFPHYIPHAVDIDATSSVKSESMSTTIVQNGGSDSEPNTRSHRGLTRPIFPSNASRNPLAALRGRSGGLEDMWDSQLYPEEPVPLQFGEYEEFERAFRRWAVITVNEIDLFCPPHPLQFNSLIGLEVHREGTSHRVDADKLRTLAFLERLDHIYRNYSWGSFVAKLVGPPDPACSATVGSSSEIHQSFHMEARKCNRRTRKKLSRVLHRLHRITTKRESVGMEINHKNSKRHPAPDDESAFCLERTINIDILVGQPASGDVDAVMTYYDFQNPRDAQSTWALLQDLDSAYRISDALTSRCTCGKAPQEFLRAEFPGKIVDALTDPGVSVLDFEKMLLSDKLDLDLLSAPSTLRQLFQFSSISRLARLKISALVFRLSRRSTFPEVLSSILSEGDVHLLYNYSYHLSLVLPNPPSIMEPPRHYSCIEDGTVKVVEVLLVDYFLDVVFSCLKRLGIPAPATIDVRADPNIGAELADAVEDIFSKISSPTAGAFYSFCLVRLLRIEDEAVVSTLSNFGIVERVVDAASSAPHRMLNTYRVIVGHLIRGRYLNDLIDKMLDAVGSGKFSPRNGSLYILEFFYQSLFYNLSPDRVLTSTQEERDDKHTYFSYDRTTYDVVRTVMSSEDLRAVLNSRTKVFHRTMYKRVFSVLRRVLAKDNGGASQELISILSRVLAGQIRFFRDWGLLLGDSPSGKKRGSSKRTRRNSRLALFRTVSLGNLGTEDREDEVVLETDSPISLFDEDTAASIFKYVGIFKLMDVQSVFGMVKQIESFDPVINRFDAVGVYFSHNLEARKAIFDVLFVLLRERNIFVSIYSNADLWDQLRRVCIDSKEGSVVIDMGWKIVRSMLLYHGETLGFLISSNRYLEFFDLLKSGNVLSNQLKTLNSLLTMAEAEKTRVLQYGKHPRRGYICGWKPGKPLSRTEFNMCLRSMKSDVDLLCKHLIKLKIHSRLNHLYSKYSVTQNILYVRVMDVIASVMQQERLSSYLKKAFKRSKNSVMKEWYTPL